MEVAADAADVGEVELLTLRKVGVDPLLRCPSSTRAFLLLETTSLWDQDLLLARLLALIAKILKGVFQRRVPTILLGSMQAQLAALTFQ